MWHFHSGLFDLFAAHGKLKATTDLQKTTLNSHVYGPIRPIFSIKYHFELLVQFSMRGIEASQSTVHVLSLGLAFAELAKIM